jgi:hypothetical protein
MKTKSLFKSLFFSLLLIGNFTKLNGQSVTSATFTVCPLNTYTFIFNAPSGWSDVVVEWYENSWYLGTGGNPPTYDDIGDPDDGGIENGIAHVMWGGTFAPLQLKLTGKVTYKFAGANGTTQNGQWDIEEDITLKGIPSTVTFNNPKLSIQKCCAENVTYTMYDVGDANIYEWTYPVGWIPMGATNQQSITLKPVTNNGGVVKCKMKMSCSPATYSIEREIAIARFDPAVVLTAGNVRGNNQFGGICPLRNYVYKIDPASKVCGATLFTWSFPQSWQVNNGQIGGGTPPLHTFYINGQNSSEVTIQTSQNPSNGPVSVTAHFSGCNSVTATVQATILSAPPATTTFVNEDFEFYHCGEWKMCATGGQLPITVSGADYVDYYTFTIDPPRYFTSQQGAVQQKVVAFGHQDFGKTPIIQGSGGATQLDVSATNCQGTNAASSITIVDEDPAWCPGTPFWQPYPSGCECCEPGEDPNPKKIDNEQAQFRLTPNPTQGYLNIHLPTNTPAQISIYTTEGKLIEHFTLIGENIEYQLDSKINAGIYIVHIIQADASAIEKLIVLK